MSNLRLGVNIDHVATLRNARGGDNPEILRAVQICEKANAQGITVHLREDRRHIKDEDVYTIKSETTLPLNLEIAATSEMQKIALEVLPNACCIVPEKREELTTEGGLDVVSKKEELKEFVKPIKTAGIRVSLFIDADPEQIKAAKEVGADIIEIHTGTYCNTIGNERRKHLEEITSGAKLATELGIECHAGHGLTYANVKEIAAIPEIVELNIGHFLIGESVFVGLEEAINKMKKIMDEARS